jgi:hypothetical protein
MNQLCYSDVLLCENPRLLFVYLKGRFIIPLAARTVDNRPNIATIRSEEKKTANGLWLKPPRYKELSWITFRIGVRNSMGHQVS